MRPFAAAGLLLASLSIGCTPAVGLVFSPEALDFGEVDFAGELPEEGYAVETVTLTNEGASSVGIALPEYDTDRLCLAGFGSQDFPVDLGELDAGSAYTFSVGVCAYVSGELNAPVATALEVDGDDGTVTLPITFTPVRTAE
ncbi:MAG: hypothetical protein Q8P18_09635 [Pseudomonadota bacterium]|nr:hypothetical protein [Pseudomonadota bacterium]